MFRLNINLKNFPGLIGVSPYDNEWRKMVTVNTYLHEHIVSYINIIKAFLFWGLWKAVF